MGGVCSGSLLATVLANLTFRVRTAFRVAVIAHGGDRGSDMVSFIADNVGKQLSRFMEFIQFIAIILKSETFIALYTSIECVQNI